MRIDPGSTIGIIGGGQLGKMLAVAASQLGFGTHVFAPETDPIAAQVADVTTTAGGRASTRASSTSAARSR